MGGDGDAPPDAPVDAAFFETLVAQSPDAVVSVDVSGTVRYANPAVEPVFGYAPQTLVGMPVEALLPERLRETARDAVRSYLDGGERAVEWRGAELLARTADGETLPVSVSVVEHRPAGCRLFSAVVRDISTRVDREEELTRRIDELESEDEGEGGGGGN